MAQLAKILSDQNYSPAQQQRFHAFLRRFVTHTPNGLVLRICGVGCSGKTVLQKLICALLEANEKRWIETPERKTELDIIHNEGFAVLCNTEDRGAPIVWDERFDLLTVGNISDESKEGIPEDDTGKVCVLRFNNVIKEYDTSLKKTLIQNISSINSVICGER